MKKKSLTAILAGAFLGLTVVAPSQGATLYADANYRGQSYSGSSSSYLGAMNDKTSSIRNYGQYKEYYADINFKGGGFAGRIDIENLWGKRVAFVGFINDEISSFR